MKPTFDIARHELIGLDVTVDGHSGRVVDETKHTFLVETPSGVKRIPKPGRRFRFEFEGKACELEGNDIAFQPEDRIKKVRS
ncbi:MAG: ribonuclease P protein subunit [Candidatus Thermoplasmatota archaeon]